MQETKEQGRLWIRLMKANKSIRDVSAIADRNEPEEALREVLPTLDLSQPMWMPRHKADWEEYSFTHFLPEHFVDSVPFDRMEIRYIFPENAAKPARRRSILEDV